MLDGIVLAMEVSKEMVYLLDLIVLLLFLEVDELIKLPQIVDIACFQRMISL